MFYRFEKHRIVCIRIQEGMAILTVARANRDIEAWLGELTPMLRAQLKGLVKKINAMK